MESAMRATQLRITGMTCIGCQNKIERKLKRTPGVAQAKVSYSEGMADVIYDTRVISLQRIVGVIEEQGYEVVPDNQKREIDAKRVLGTLIMIVSLYMVLEQFGLLNLLVPGQLADAKMGYGMLFVIGLATSVHCIAMCGGINLSQCILDGPSNEKQGRMAIFAPAFLYNLGRVISYTVIGFILGFAGLFFGGGSGAGLPLFAQGILKLAAGFFMVIMGLNMLALFPALRRLQPRIPQIFASKIKKGKAPGSPFIVGLLNGLMPCGPLQSMQIVALASGNPITGALSMLLFSLGTVPLMLGLGSVVSALGKRFTTKVMNGGAVLVVVFGLAMLSQGGSLSGLISPERLLVAALAFSAVGVISSISFKQPSYRKIALAAGTVMAVGAILTLDSVGVGSADTLDSKDGNVQIVDGVQVVNSELTFNQYPDIQVQEEIPVKWIINAPKGSINGCNNRINIPEYGIYDYPLKEGENIIEFIPENNGQFQYSCWMGMLRSSITVVGEDGTVADDADDGSGRESGAASGGCCGR